jgi:uncharacterized damage-inducible protein DinB
VSTDRRAAEFVGYASHKLRQNLAQISRCARALDTDQVWHRATPRNNSVGNLILHLTGNVRQWIIGGVGRTPAERDRQAEFAERGPLPVESILAELERVVMAACDGVERLSATDLESRRTIQDYDVAVIVAVMHVVEHFSWHTGQIVHMTKALCDADLSVYDARGRRLDQTRNRP